MAYNLVTFAIFCMVTFIAVPIKVDGYTFPEVRIIAIKPIGLKVSIPATPGIKLFAFHARVNQPIGDHEAGEIEGDVSKIVDNRLTIFSERTILLAGDTINYWIYIQDDKGQHKKTGLTHRIGELVSNDTVYDAVTESDNDIKFPDDLICLPSITKMEKNERVCKGDLIFEENFNGLVLSLKKWNVDQKLSSGDRENAFVSYQKQMIKIENGMMKIKPELLSSMRPFNLESIETGILDLTVGCTSYISRECIMDTSNPPYLLPPVITGKINTKNLFSFKYGKVEIKAKLPEGDWIYPELYLEPERSHYGSAGYESGLIRIAFLRGNEDLRSATRSYGNNVLSGGLVLNQFEPCRSDKTAKENPSTDKAWTKDFHLFGLLWSEDRIQFSVDGEVYGTIGIPFGGFVKSDTLCKRVPFSRWAKGGPFAPFDQEFYISLGVAVGGVSDFPDHVGNKPWLNRSGKSRQQFWEDRNRWNATWGEGRALLVDYVKVWAL